MGTLGSLLLSSGNTRVVAADDTPTVLSDIIAAGTGVVVPIADSASCEVILQTQGCSTSTLKGLLSLGASIDKRDLGTKQVTSFLKESPPFVDKCFGCLAPKDKADVCAVYNHLKLILDEHKLAIRSPAECETKFSGASMLGFLPSNDSGTRDDESWTIKELELSGVLNSDITDTFLSAMAYGFGNMLEEGCVENLETGESIASCIKIVNSTNIYDVASNNDLFDVAKLEEELLKYKPYGVNGGTFYRSVSEISTDLNDHVRSVENKFGLGIDIGDWMKFAVAHDTQVTSAVYNSNWYHSLHTGSTLGELTLSNQDARRALLDKPKKDMAEIATEQDAWEFIPRYGIGFFKRALIGGVYQLDEHVRNATTITESDVETALNVTVWGRTGTFTRRVGVDEAAAAIKSKTSLQIYGGDYAASEDYTEWQGTISSRPSIHGYAVEPIYNLADRVLYPTQRRLLYKAYEDFKEYFPSFDADDFLSNKQDPVSYANVTKCQIKTHHNTYLRFPPNSAIVSQTSSPIDDDTKFYIIKTLEGHFIIKDKEHQRYLRFENDFSEVVQTCSIEDNAERFIVGPSGSNSLGRDKKFYIQSYQWQDRYLRADSNAAIVNQKRHKKDWEEFTCIPWAEEES